MTIDAIIMMVITLVGYIGGFSYFMIHIEKERSRDFVRSDRIPAPLLFMHVY